MSTDTNSNRNPAYLAKITLGALGVVFGDIGTSPLYAVRECFRGPHALEVSDENILGVLSLIFWALMIVISFKYLLYVMRADNRGEGGVLALMSLATGEQKSKATALRTSLVLMGLFGAALLYGDGMITPAISVLSAIEGLNVATPVFDRFVVPITIVILFVLFFMQRHGTARLGAFFGPVILTWFVVIAFLGIMALVKEPRVLEAVLPTHAVRFFAANRVMGFLALGTIFLVATGGEALYADMGHFGKRPIRLGWFAIVLPCLLLNYFGQGALLISTPEAAANPFYHLAPAWSLYPLVILATLATVIASQAVISGAFSLTLQAVQFGYLPRLEIRHTSSEEIGQIYVPYINWLLLAATVWLVAYFQSSSHLAAAYGVAVTTTMVITTILVFFTAKTEWGWKLPVLVPLTAGLLIVDLGFFGANMSKVAHGGWFPLLIAAAAMTLMTTWRRGRAILGRRMTENVIPVGKFIERVTETPPSRVPGVAVFMTGNFGVAPPALTHNFEHNKIIHETTVLLTVLTEDRPHVPYGEQLEVEPLTAGFYRIVLRYGFMDTANVPAALRRLSHPDLKFDPLEATYFLGRETLLATKRPGMMIWRERLFAFMSQNSQQATAFFHIPPDKVVEIGLQVEI